MIQNQAPSLHHRRSIRLRGYDYAQPGAYFVTICTYQWEELFGKVINGRVELNQYGRIVEAAWVKIPQIRPYIAMDEFIIMPNHIHGIIMIRDESGNVETVGATHWVAPTEASTNPRGPAPNSLGAITGQFKLAATKQINRLRDTPGQLVWQRNYFEHVIRNERALNRIRTYVHYNPRRWHLDRYNSANLIGKEQVLL